MKPVILLLASAFAVVSNNLPQRTLAADTPGAVRVAEAPAGAAQPPANGFRMISRNDTGYQTFSMFGSEAGAAKFLVNDTVNRKYVGLFHIDKPFPEKNEWALDVDEYLTVIQGALKIEFLPGGATVVVRAGDQAYLPAGSKLHLTALELPYAESFVMIAPPK